MAEYMKNAGMNMVTGLITIALTILGAVLFFLSYTTGYYTFGQMNSTVITVLICLALIAECASLIAMKKFPDKLWAKCVTFLVTGLLAAAAILILGDRVEGIGNCIVTDYDSGHGGEEAIYMSIVGACTLLLGIVFNCIGAFSADGNAPVSREKKIGFFSAAGILGLVSVLAATALTGVLKTGSSAAGAGGTAGGSAGTYAVALNQENGNVGEDVCPDYQFLSTDLAMLCRMDSRFYIDVTLKTDGADGYTITSDAYVIEAGKRAEIGDPSGLGIVCITTGEGTYTDNGDGTITTSPATHGTFKIESDTYSAQMKDLMAIDMNGSNADGEYDSADYPVILDYFPETIWTVSGSEITTYAKAEDAAEGATGATASAAEAAAEEEPADDAASGFEIASDDGATKMIFGADGTYTFVFEQYGIEDAGTYTFADGVLTLTDANGKETTAEGDPLKLHYEYSQSNQLTGDFTIPVADLG